MIRLEGEFRKAGAYTCMTQPNLIEEAGRGRKSSCAICIWEMVLTSRWRPIAVQRGSFYPGGRLGLNHIAHHALLEL